MGLSGCTGALSTLDPAGPAARSIATLWWVMLAGSLAILALVTVLLALALRPGRRTHGEPGGAVLPEDPGSAGSGSERRWILGLGLVFPVAVLAGLLATGLWLGELLLHRPVADIVRVEAQARQWSWTFGYADAPGHQTVDVLHIPAGRPVEVAIRTADVIHSFWVPRLAGKLDAIPGHVNRLRIEADAPGSYAGRSAEYSGTGYDRHGFTVIAHDEAGWQAFLEQAR